MLQTSQQAHLFDLKHDAVAQAHEEPESVREQLHRLPTARSSLSTAKNVNIEVIWRM